jgi:hypothetical protein
VQPLLFAAVWGLRPLLFVAVWGLRPLLSAAVWIDCGVALSNHCCDVTLISALSSTVKCLLSYPNHDLLLGFCFSLVRDLSTEIAV